MRADFPASGENVRYADKRGTGPVGLDFCVAKRLGERGLYLLFEQAVLVAVIVEFPSAPQLQAGFCIAFRIKFD